MPKINIRKIRETKKRKVYEVNYSLSNGELFNQLSIDDNDGSNDIILNISEKIKPLLKKSEKELADTWKLVNTQNLINFTFILELKED